MRDRRLFSVAEGYAFRRLADGSGEGATRRAVITLELARTLAAHGSLRLGVERADLFSRAERTLDGVGSEPFATEAEVVSAEVALTAADGAAADLTYLGRGTREEVAAAYRVAVDRSVALDAILGRRLASALRGRAGGAVDASTWARLRGRVRVGRAYAVIGFRQFSDETDDTLFDEAERAVADFADGWDGDALVRSARVVRADLLRARGRFVAAEGVLRKVTATPAERDLWRSKLRVQARLALDRGEPAEAAALLLGVRPRGPAGEDGLPRRGELVGDEGLVLGLVGLVRCVGAAGEAGDAELEAELAAAVAAEAGRIESERGGAWGARAVALAGRVGRGRRAGEAAATLAREAEAARADGRIADAARLWAGAAAEAESAATAIGWAVESSRLFVRLGDFAAAASVIESAAAESAGGDDTSAAAAAHWAAVEGLLDAPAAASAETALRTHRVLFASSRTAPAATARLATVLVADGRKRAACELYAGLAGDRVFGPSARVAFVKLLDDLAEEIGRSAASERLDAVIGTLPSDDEAWSPRDAEFALRAVVWRLGMRVAGDVTAVGLAGRVARVATQKIEDAAAAGDDRVGRYWRAVARTAARRAVVAAVAAGDYGRARRTADDAVETPGDRFAVAGGLEDVGPPAARAERRAWAAAVVEICDDIHAPLSPDDTPADGAAAVTLAWAHHALGDDGRAGRWLTAAAGRAKKPVVLTPLALELTGPRGVSARDAVAAAIGRAERSLPPGGDDWIAGRLALADLSVRDGRADEAVRLLRVTSLLYGAKLPAATRDRLSAALGRLENGPNGPEDR